MREVQVEAERRLVICISRMDGENMSGESDDVSLGEASDGNIVAVRLQRFSLAARRLP